MSALLQSGHICSNIHSSEQRVLLDIVPRDICAETEYYKLAQFSWPGMNRVFLDVGANKGFISALFLKLWGGNAVKISPLELYKASTKRDLLGRSRHPFGMCKSGSNNGLSLSYHRLSALTSGRDAKSKGKLAASLKVYSIDGNKNLVDAMNRLIATDSNIPKSVHWKYYNFAMSNKVGSAYFDSNGGNASKQADIGFEGSKIRKGSDPSTRNGVSVLPVDMTTVDAFTDRYRIEHVDVLKIDAEGSDNAVLDGSQKLIRNSLSMFVFEAQSPSVVMTAAMIEEYDQMNFSCYSTTKYGLFKWNGGCMPQGGDAMRNKGNIFCISRSRAPLLSLTFDAVSFPALVDAVRPQHVKNITAFMDEGPPSTRKGKHSRVNSELKYLRRALVSPRILERFQVQ